MKVEPTTVQPITSLYQGPNGLPYSGMMSLTASATTLNATTTDRKTLSFTPALSNALMRGDFIRLSGAYDGYYLPVLSGTTSTCVLAVDLPANLTSGTVIVPVRPVPLTVGSGGTTSMNVAEWGGVATSLGQKAESASVPVVLATEQDAAKPNVGTSGVFQGVGAWDGFNEQWWPWPANANGYPQAQIFGINLIGNQTDFTIETLDPDYTRPGLYTRNIESRPTQSSDSITFNGDIAQVSVFNYNTVTFSISGTYNTVNLAFEASFDAGTTFHSVQAKRLGANTIETASGNLTNTTRAWQLSVDSFTQFRVRATAWTSGTATIKFSLSYQPHDVIPGIASHAIDGGYVTAYIDGTTSLQQDTITTLVYGMPAAGWDAGVAAWGVLPLSNNATTVPTEILNTVTIAPTTATLANVACGKIAAASLTGSYATVLTMGGQGRAIHLYNSTDQPVLFSLDGGTTGSVELDAGESYVIDYVANGLIATSSTIQAKYVSTAPSVGSVRAIIARA